MVRSGRIRENEGFTEEGSQDKYGFTGMQASVQKKSGDILYHRITH
jgi:hypothetical protein